MGLRDRRSRACRRRRSRTPLFTFKGMRRCRRSGTARSGRGRLVQLFSVFRSQKIPGHVLRGLEGSYPRDDRPAVLRRDLRGVAGHLAEAVRHDVEEVARALVAESVDVERARVLEAARDDHALPLARAAVARRAVDVEALLPAEEELLRDGDGEVEDELAVVADAAVERGVRAQEAARDDALGERPGRAVVREEGGLAQRLRLRLVVHGVPAAAHGEREEGEEERAPHQSSTSCTCTPPSVSMNRNVSPARNFGSRARIMRKYLSRDASWKRSTPKTGW